MLLNRLEQSSLSFFLLPRFFGLVCLWFFLSLFSLESFFYESPFCNDQLFKIESSDYAFGSSFFQYLNSLISDGGSSFPRYSQILFLLGIALSLLMFILGYFRLLSIGIFVILGTVLAQPCVLYAIQNNAGVAGEKLLACIAFLMIFYPRDPLGYGVSPWYRYCFMILLFSVLLSSSFGRVESLQWQENSAIFHALLDPTISRFSEFFNANPDKLPESLMSLISFLVLAFEASLPLLLIFSSFFFRDWLRTIFVLSAIIFQIVNATLFSTEIFAGSMILLLFASFAPSRRTDFLGGNEGPPSALNTLLE